MQLEKKRYRMHFAGKTPGDGVSCFELGYADVEVAAVRVRGWVDVAGLKDHNGEHWSLHFTGNRFDLMLLQSLFPYPSLVFDIHVEFEAAEPGMEREGIMELSQQITKMGIAKLPEGGQLVVIVTDEAGGHVGVSSNTHPQRVRHILNQALHGSDIVNHPESTIDAVAEPGGIRQLSAPEEQEHGQSDDDEDED